MANTYDLTQLGPEVQSILDKADPMPTKAEYDATILSINTAIAGKVDQAVSLTYAALKALRDGGTLVPGQLYRITDFVTTVAATIDEKSGEQLVRSAGHAFDVLVLAASPASLSETAWAAKHDGDTYFQNARLEAWQLKYCLDNDTTRFAWADQKNGKGVIYEMQDEFKNVLPYDFKNIQFKRYLITGALGIMEGYTEDVQDNDYAFILTAMKQMFNGRNDQYRLSHLAQYMHPYYGYRSEQYLYDDGYEDSWDGTYVMHDGGSRLFVSLTDEYDTNAIIAEVDKSKACWCYTFGVRTALTVTETTDHSLTGKCAENRMKAETDGGAQLLGESVFVWNSVSGYARKNEITGFFRKNTFSGYVEGCSFSGYLYADNFSGYVEYSQFSEYVDSCSFSGYVQYTSFSGNVYYSSFSGYVRYTSFSGYVSRCSFSGDVSCSSFSGYLWADNFSGNLYTLVISGYIEECTITTNGGASGTIKNLYTLGSINGETISIANNSDQPTYAAVNSDGDLQTWNPADLV